MKIKAGAAVVQEMNVPNKEVLGQHKGLWGGFQVYFSIGDSKYKFESADGVRGMNIPVIITITETEISFSTIN